MAILSPTIRQRFFTASGAPLAGGKLYTYAAGTTSDQATYTDYTEATANANPVILDANGECNLWLGNAAYKMVLKDSADVTQWTVDNVNQASENQNISGDVLENFGLTCSTNSNVLTVTVTNGTGGVPSVTNPVLVGFRSPTIGSGLSNVVSISSSLGMTVSSGSTLGHSSTVQDSIFVYLLYYNGSAEVAVSSTLYPEFALYSTTAEGGAGGADTRATIYSVTARTNVPLRLVGRLTITQSTAGAWVTLPSQIQTSALDQVYTDSKVLTTRPTVQRFTSGSGTYTTPANVRYLKVKMCGAGGGGAGGGTSGGPGGAGDDGGATTFGTSLLTCNGGDGADPGGNKGGNGGTSVVSSPAIAITTISGGGGGTTSQQGTSGTSIFNGSNGGVNPFGGSNGALWASSGQNGTDDTGAGGSGGSMTTNGTANSFAGSGGGAGGFIEAYIHSPNATYSYAVGAGGSGGTAGTNGGAGGGGANGIIIVEEFYV